ncbi:MAG: glycosyltransferase family 4 protein [Verrucomicrobiae bacterium]|nr:glycosyltransferase family 4 protein [Verrucomicrobiae bacterium]
MNTSPPADTGSILFLGHEATRTGAPLFMLHVLRWLRENRPYPLEVFLIRGGELEQDYAALGRTKSLAAAFRRDLPEKLYYGLHRHLTSEQRWQRKVRRRVKLRQPALIYANTAAAAAAVEACAGLGIPIIWNIHELPFHIGEFNTTGNFDRARGLADQYIVPSPGVKLGLVERHAIAPEKIAVVSGFVRPEDHARHDQAACRAALRRELGLPADAFIAGACGLVSWLKGVDWFLATAKILQVEFPGAAIHLVWLGRPESERRQREVDFDLRQAGLESHVHFLGARPESAPVLAGLDAFFLSSREDSNPLVMLEAGFHGLPIVCFDRSGGGPAFVGSDAGVICDFGDTRAAARALVGLKEQPETRRQMGAAARGRVLAQYQLEQQVPKIGALIDRMTAAPGRTASHPEA